MKVKKTIGDWINGVCPALREIMQLSLPPVPGYRISRAGMAIETALKPFEAKRNELVAKHANGLPAVPVEKIADLRADLEPLLSEELEIDLGDPASVASMGGTAVKPVLLAAASELFAE